MMLRYLCLSTLGALLLSLPAKAAVIPVAYDFTGTTSPFLFIGTNGTGTVTNVSDALEVTGPFGFGNTFFDASSFSAPATLADLRDTTVSFDFTTNMGFGGFSGPDWGWVRLRTNDGASNVELELIGPSWDAGQDNAYGLSSPGTPPVITAGSFSVNVGDLIDGLAAHQPNGPGSTSGAAAATAANAFVTALNAGDGTFDIGINFRNFVDGNAVVLDNLEITGQIPEPASLGLLSLAFGAVVLRRRK